MSYNNRVKETTASTGTGNIALFGAVSQFVSFSSRYALGDAIKYSLVGATGSEWEVGQGHLLDATTLVRDVVEQSSNADALVNFSAGIKDIFVSFNAGDANYAANSIGVGIAMKYYDNFL